MNESSPAITPEWLIERGFVPRTDDPSCWVQDFGDGFRLQLVAHMSGWGVEVWNGTESVLGRATFLALATRQDQIWMMLEMMGEIPF